MYIDKLGNTVDKYNKTYYIEQEKWSLLMLRQGHILTLMLKILIKILGFKLVIMGEHQFSYLLKSNLARLKSDAGELNFDNIKFW